MTVCERIDNILKEKGMSRRKLAIIAGIAPSSFQSAMARNGSLSYDMLIPISNALGIPTYELEGYKLKHDTPENRAEADAAFKAVFGRRKANDASSWEPVTFEQLHAEQQAYLAARMEKAFNNLNEIGQIEACKRVEEMSIVEEYQRIPYESSDIPIDNKKPSEGQETPSDGNK